MWETNFCCKEQNGVCKIKIKMQLSKKQNIHAAPTNFKALNGSVGVPFKWWPSDENIYIADRVLHEYFASLKAAL